MGELWVAGEDIDAGLSVVCNRIDGKAYAAGEVCGVFIGNAAEQLREGFRVCLRPDGQIYEDDA